MYDVLDKKHNIAERLKQMRLKSLMMFEYENLPSTIDPRNMERIMQRTGVVGIVPVGGEIYALSGGVGGLLDANNHPTILTVANAFLNYSKELKIGTECEVIRNDSESMGLEVIGERYASQLIENEITMNLMLINRRIIDLISCADDNTKKAAEEMIRKIEEGRLAIMYHNPVLESLKVLPYSTSTNLSLTENIEYEQYVLGHWLADIGLDSNFNMKREALNSAESELNKDNLFPQIDNMLYEREQGVKRVNDMFGTDIRVRLASTWRDNREELQKELDKEGGDADEAEEPVSVEN